MTLREQIQSDMKDAMRAHDAAKLNAIRMLWSSVKQKEVDERITADDSVITARADVKIWQPRSRVRLMFSPLISRSRSQKKKSIR